MGGMRVPHTAAKRMCGTGCHNNHMPPLLEAESLTIRFGETKAVDNISFHIDEGECLGLVGESGSGKSVTSLAILRLLDKAATIEGAIRFNGTDLLALSENNMRSHRGKDISMIFQEPMTALNPSMSVGDQIAEAVRVHHPKLSKAEVRERVLESLNDVALPDPTRRSNDYPHQFSGGQRQRIMIAMAVVNKPRLLIADEPTTALDVTVQAQVLRLLRDLRDRHGLSMLFISHDLAVTAQTADRIAVMQRGHIVETGATTTLFRHPQHPYTQALLAAVPTMRTDRSRPLATLQRAV
jgi:peptide/nickel transport system ATP-binding protein